MAAGEACSGMQGSCGPAEGHTMDYTKYFKSKQQVLLKTLTEANPLRSEVFTAYLVRCCADFFEMELPYTFRNGSDQLFGAGTKICLLSDAFGMGVQLTGHFHSRTGETTFRITPHDDLVLFCRRKHCRVDIQAELFCKWGGRNLDALRGSWIASVHATEAGSPFPNSIIPVRREINLSAGGLAIHPDSAISMGEFSLMMLILPDGTPPVWIIGEVVWTRTEETVEPLAGLRFVEIMTADQERINMFVLNELKAQGQDIHWNNYRRDLLTTLQY